MFIRSTGPVGEVFNEWQGQWGSSPETNFAFDLSNTDLFLKQDTQSLYLLYAKQVAFCAGLQKMAPSRSENSYGTFNVDRPESQQYQLRTNDFDQSMVWFQNMEDPNEAFRSLAGNSHHHALTELTLAPGHHSQHVSHPSSRNSNHGNVRARRQSSFHANNGASQPEANLANAESIWNTASNSSRVNDASSRAANPQGSHRWPAAPGGNNEYIQAYGFHDHLAHGLPIFQSSQTVGPSFDLGTATGGVPNPDSSSSSSCRVNGSSPNTLFGSFSSSIGPPDMMDMDVTDECFHSPSVFPAEAPSCHNPGAIPPAFLSTSLTHSLPIAPRAVFAEPETISPNMLRLKNVPSLPSSSSSESLHNPFRMDSDSDVASGVPVSQEEILSSSVRPARRESASKINPAGRKQLPDKAPRAKAAAPASGPKRRHGGEAAADKASATNSKRTKPKTKAPSNTQSHSSHQRHTGGSEANVKPTHGKASSKALASTNSDGAAEASVTPPRSERDEFLVTSKMAGMTYKEIRKKGGFTEAESTLRGRFRTLTKPKEARVRKPEFLEIDDKLLKRAVIKFTKDVDEITRDNVPWKLVSEYIVDHGGSYLFGYTTVRKRWEYLMVTSEEQVRQDRQDHKFQL